MPYMWADALMQAERTHVLRLLAWGATCVLAGSAVLAWMRVGARRSALLEQFSWQMAGWGAAWLAVGASWLTVLAPRDLAAATRLDRLLWLEIGLAAGGVLVGLTLVTVGSRPGRRLAPVGAGLGIVVQGLALGVLTLTLAARIFR